MAASAPPIYRFGEFRLNPAARELWRDTKEQTLPLKAFACLLYLVKNRDRAVGRDELIDAVWGAGSIWTTAYWDMRFSPSAAY